MSPPPDLYCTLEVDSFGYFVSKAKTRVFRDTTEPQWNEVRGGCGVWGRDRAHLPAQALELIQVLVLSHPLSSPQEFEIELEGSQSLRILCYEKCYDKTKLNKDNNEIVDKIMGKGQIQVCAGAFRRLLTLLGLVCWAGRWCVSGLWVMIPVCNGLSRSTEHKGILGRWQSP